MWMHSRFRNQCLKFIELGQTPMNRDMLSDVTLIILLDSGGEDTQISGPMPTPIVNESELQGMQA